ncbi:MULTISPECIES: alpha/beta hydrolase [Rhodanobacteraceae]|uniref:alpha/beta fold hydrolase n=1 Tax=Rhodanobacteraceae TaxID=1775411 RepID=UPI00088E2EA4|nr:MULTISPECIES: alpha/beta hydrolase [Rhodanobacteraceae]SDG02128.1 Pimeloyl-ACP methyl ester carboxylesterase [Dyella sp. 333MFSha]SKB30733.1 Pimeloyl-ACP methyl ester carboxylesterase [Luteibacter sp. 22Crub2.1]
MSTQVIHGLAVELNGEGDETILCIHGLGGSSNLWTPLIPAFDGKRIVRIDLPGSARSDLLSSPLSIKKFVASVVSVLDALHLPSVHVAAHSMGTIVAQHLAVAHPDRVLSLALFGALAAQPDAAKVATRARAEAARQGIAAMQDIADAITKAATSAATKSQSPAVIAAIREMVMRQPPEGYAQSCEALAEATPAAIENVEAPVLLVTGSEDGVGSPDGNKALAARFSRAQLVIVNDCGHWTPLEKPFECIDALRGFYAH